MAAGDLPPAQAVELAMQIARGLAAAHEKGVIHRDLKPDNVFLTRDGQAKILDFGLARVVEPPAASELSAAPTLERTGVGAQVGTPGYMSPEQVRGLPADHRSDVFALGILLYEMLTGQRAFERHVPLRGRARAARSGRGGTPPARPGHRAVRRRSLRPLQRRLRLRAGRALGALESCMRVGWGNREWMAHDSDFASIRDHPRFQALLADRPAS